MRIKLTAILLCLVMLLMGCGKNNGKDNIYTNSGAPGNASDLGDDNTSYGDSLDDLGVNEGYFEGEATDIAVNCESGTQNAYKLEGTTLTFTAVSEDTVYSLSGQFSGNIVVDIGENYKFDLELCGVSLVSKNINPIIISSGNEVSIKAKKDTKNYIYDKRAEIDSADETLFSGAIHSEVDLEIGGKGELNVISENNNGIHSKDDLQVKNLTLTVACIDNALKGNDSVEITGGNTTLIASRGDGIKTANSDISEKGNQRGIVSIAGGTHNIYAACDGIDAAYNAIVDDNTTVLNIYTDKYSNYSDEVTATSSNNYYIRFTSNAYSYSVKYYNSDTDYTWVNATYHSSVSGFRSTYYYYTFPKNTEYSKMQFFIYSSDMAQGQSDEYLVASDYLEPNTAYDTFALSSRGNQLTYSWTNYTTNIQEGGFGGPGGPGGMDGGNTDKGDHSTKGIKAANEIVINNGTVNVKSYDDAIHANNDTTLENGSAPLGNVTVNGGNITVYSNDDGLHADGTLRVTSGAVSITNSYEGIEGTSVSISGGYVSVYARDDGVNATTTSGTAVSISGGTLYIYCSGDGIDSNSRTSYSGIVFSGGNTVVISNSNGNSAIDTEQGYSYEGGSVLAIMPRGGMSSESTHCNNFSSIGKSTQLSLTKDSFLVAEIGEKTATVKIPVSISALVITLGDKSSNISTKSSVDINLDRNNVAWN